MGRHKGCLGLRGDKHPNSKLTNAERRMVRDWHATAGWSVGQLAEMLGVGRTTISNVLASEFPYDD